MLSYEHGKLYVEDDGGEKRFEYECSGSEPFRPIAIAILSKNCRERLRGKAFSSVCVAATQQAECIFNGRKIVRRLATDEDLEQIFRLWDKHDDFLSIEEWLDQIVLESKLLSEEKVRIRRIALAVQRKTEKTLSLSEKKEVVLMAIIQKTMARYQNVHPTSLDNKILSLYETALIVYSTESNEVFQAAIKDL